MQDLQDDETKRPMPCAGQPGGSGRVAAFEEAYLRYAPRLRRIATGKFGIAAPDADALVHDVFATYFLHAETVRKLEPYLIGAICNAARYHLRRAGTAHALFCDETPCAATPDDALASEIERKVLVSRMLARVGRRCRDLLHRYYVNGETTQSIACGMQMKPATILVFLSRCRARARHALDSMGRH
jgi:RNA polymerase sigma factor (sigma-70 family)